MPELPEVETVRRGLEPVLAGRRLLSVEQRRPDLRWPLPERFAERLTGTRVERLRRRSKYLLADLGSGETLLIHLGMTGRMLIGDEIEGRFVHPVPNLARHDHVVFHVEGGVRVTFNDVRRFGAMDLIPPGGEDGHWLLRDIGPEPLGNAFSAAHLIERLKGRVSPIKAMLLDQRIVAGLGNIYVCEALWRAGIAPTRRAGRISAERLGRLATAIREVLEEAIAAGGSSLRDYRQATGELGYFQHGFAVYGREGEPCRTEGCPGVIRRTVQSGRSSFHCPVCQR
ncbi:MAG TPA: bifunctional DNA-formamidopyrimidine glycosylase/DNA-(apurinic or apyrimidinic site) lyase [Paracoccaceae bacterium]|nr:bifunctional DNA-formamidopyrimidine glycosylase/DNA-(apurinic or apyrimidinic site) lyase [Paracoccaceae bacterium]